MTYTENRLTIKDRQCEGLTSWVMYGRVVNLDVNLDVILAMSSGLMSRDISHEFDGPQLGDFPGVRFDASKRKPSTPRERRSFV
jgi:hypothetical protein